MFKYNCSLQKLKKVKAKICFSGIVNKDMQSVSVAHISTSNDIAQIAMNWRWRINPLTYPKNDVHTMIGYQTSKRSGISSSTEWVMKVSLRWQEVTFGRPRKRWSDNIPSIKAKKTKEQAIYLNQRRKKKKRLCFILYSIYIPNSSRALKSSKQSELRPQLLKRSLDYY